MKKAFYWIERICERFYHRIIANTFVTNKEIGYYRIFVGVFFLVFRPSYLWLGQVPQGFFRPNVLTPSFLFDSFPPAYYFQFTDILIIVLLLFFFLGIKCRLSSLLLFLIIIINNSFAYSFGKIDHSIFTPVLFLLFSFTNAGTYFALWPDKKIKIHNLSVSIFALCLVFAFFTAGLEKALTWVDFDLSTSGISSWFYDGYFTLERTQLLAEYFFHSPAWLQEIMDYTAVIFELSGLFFLFYSRKTWILYLIIASVFHLTNTLILNIPFLTNLPVYGLWLLAPVLLKYKRGLVFLLLPLFLKGLYLVVILWSAFIINSLIGWQKGFYRIIKHQ